MGCGEVGWGAVGWVGWGEMKGLDGGLRIAVWLWGQGAFDCGVMAGNPCGIEVE